ncbi:hypothetical protein BD410DRAFT_819350 [Rickenella mellea]|uniref:Thioredoxin domain-containing protein n=1 Tax=Rickenella mellea TaxID=50990 RepID=A0A4Y7QIH5_9AGAM|nr:hypothetical protein BD410DRAFT_819350 [Rickenella mellea]
MLPQLLALSLALAPNVVSAAIFPEGSLVKMIDHKGFKDAMKQNMTSVVAFVAPWCGHCQRLAPEYSRAALGLYPLIPLYAVDCDNSKNKRLCADQGVKGFPTLKLYPRGKKMAAIEYDGQERTASAFFYWATRAVPVKVKKIKELDDIAKWAVEGISKPRALLMNKSNKMPLLWTVLNNKYKDQIIFASHRDRKGRDSVKLGFEAGPEKSPKVLIYPEGDTKPVKYDGLMKFDSLSKFFDSLLDGSVDLTLLNQESAKEEFIPTPEELDIEQRQEAEMLKLAHGGYAEMIDFEKAVKDGSAKNFHGENGFPGMMGGKPQQPAAEKVEEGVKEAPMSQTETGHPTTPAPTPTPTEAPPAADPTPPTEPSVVVQEPVVVEETKATEPGRTAAPTATAKESKEHVKEEL